MRKWLWIGALALAVTGVGGYWSLDRAQRAGLPSLTRETIRPNSAVHDGDGETSEVIEPLVVEPGPTSVPCVPAPSVVAEPPTRVLLTRGMTQPPRPDAELGQMRRMPYADEEEILAVPLDPMVRILESNLPRLNIFDDLKHDPAEEAENQTAPATPTPTPAMDFHHQYPHCPRDSYPYRR